jgi:hypothetical protein
MSTFLGKKRIDAKDKRQITKDWLSVFTAFKEYKPMWIIRRNGPFLCGIFLQRNSSNIDYKPLFHVYNLMVDFPVISLNANMYLLNHKMARDSVTLLQHQESFNSYAERLKQQVSLLQKDALTCNELVSHIKKIAQNSYLFENPALSSDAWAARLFQGIVLTLFWFGRTAEAEQEIENAKKIISGWDDNVWVIKELGVDGWERQTRRLMNMDTLRVNVETQIQKYKLNGLIDYQLSI